MPLEPGFSGASSLAGVDVQVSREGEWLTYRADYLGRTYTAYAGLIAATAENGIGGRGIAPEVQLRGYNGLNAERQFSGLVDSLGVSTYFPDSTDAHVFNMSFGSSAPEPGNIDVYFERVFTHGVRNLRSGLGAIFVKAVGNDFRDCSSLMRDINESLGCGSSNGDDWSNLPYVIAVGAFNADGGGGDSMG